MERIQGGVCAPQGFLAAGVHCGILKNKQKKDLALIYSLSEANAAAVYTKNLEMCIRDRQRRYHRM